jgi:hypothetical protein
MEKMKNKIATLVSILLLILFSYNLYFIDSHNFLHYLIYNFSTSALICLGYFINKEKIIDSNISNKLKLIIKTLFLISFTCLILSLLTFLFFYPEGNDIVYTSISLINSLTFLSFLYIEHYKIL